MDGRLVIRLLHALHAEEVAYKVVGAVALNLHGLARATEDLDLFVDPGEENVARLRRALHRVFDDASIDEIEAADLAGDYPVIQYVPPTEGFHVDLLVRLGEAFGYDDIETDRIDVEGVPVPVASARMLYRMKHATVRPQDRADAARLKQKFRLED